MLLQSSCDRAKCKAASNAKVRKVVVVAAGRRLRLKDRCRSRFAVVTVEEL